MSNNKKYIIEEVSDVINGYIKRVMNDGYDNYDSAKEALLDIGCVHESDFFFIDNKIFKICEISINERYVIPEYALRVEKELNKRRFLVCYIARIKGSNIPMLFDSIDRMIDYPELNRATNAYKILIPNNVNFVTGAAITAI